MVRRDTCPDQTHRRLGVESKRRIQVVPADPQQRADRIDAKAEEAVGDAWPTRVPRFGHQLEIRLPPTRTRRVGPETGTPDHGGGAATEAAMNSAICLRVLAIGIHHQRMGEALALGFRSTRPETAALAPLCGSSITESRGQPPQQRIAEPSCCRRSRPYGCPGGARRGNARGEDAPGV